MQCLYCKKKLGLFASRKKQFCSEEHEASYNEDQASVALRRVLDPLFTERLEKQPLQPPPPPKGGPASARTPLPEFNLPSYLPSSSALSSTGEREATSAPASASTSAPAPELARKPALTRLAPPTPPQPEAATFQPVVAPPPLVSFYRQGRPIPHPSTQNPSLTPFGSEPLGGEMELPRRFGALIEDERLEDQPGGEQTGVVAAPHVAQAARPEMAEAEVVVPPAVAAPVLAQEARPELVEAEMVAAPVLDSHRLYPVIPQEKPAWAEMGPHDRAAHSPRQLSFRTPILKSGPPALEALAEEREMGEAEVAAEPVEVESAAAGVTAPPAPIVLEPAIVPEPAVVLEPAAVSEPAIVAKPAVFAKPAIVPEPAVVAKPEVLARPAIVSEPAIVAKPEAFAKPAIVSEPAVVAKLEAFAKPEVVLGPAIVSEPAVVAKPEVVARPEVVLGPASVPEPAVVAKPTVVLEPVIASGPAIASEPAVVSEPVIASEPACAGLVWVEALRPRAAEARRKAVAETPGSIEPRLTLRYPSARIAIGQRILVQAVLRRTGDRPAGALPNPMRQAVDLQEPSTREARIPEPRVAPQSGRPRLSALAGGYELPRQVQKAGLRDVRWKMFTTLREAPAKLAIPQAGSGRSGRRPLAQPVAVAGSGSIERRAIQPAKQGNLLAREPARDLAAVELPAAPAEVLEAKVAVRMSTADWLRLEPQAHADRRQHYRPSSLLAGLTGFQKARAASYIQIREPELRQAIPGGLPRGVAGTAWFGVSLGLEELPLRAAVPLRPAVRVPEWE